jgi:predicted SprT family Zn-dependent metalloprotease
MGGGLLSILQNKDSTMNELIAYWQELQKKWELDDWQLVINSRYTSSLGRCVWKPRKQLHIAKWVVDSDLEEAKETLRHEIAHALAGEKAKHGAVWRRWARIVGARPKACATATISNMSPSRQTPPKWRITCPDCKQWYLRRRRTYRTYYHSICPKVTSSLLKGEVNFNQTAYGLVPMVWSLNPEREQKKEGMVEL